MRSHSSTPSAVSLPSGNSDPQSIRTGHRSIVECISRCLVLCIHWADDDDHTELIAKRIRKVYEGYYFYEWQEIIIPFAVTGLDGEQLIKMRLARAIDYVNAYPGTLLKVWYFGHGSCQDIGSKQGHTELPISRTNAKQADSLLWSEIGSVLEYIYQQTKARVSVYYNTSYAAQAFHTSLGRQHLDHVGSSPVRELIRESGAACARESKLPKTGTSMDWSSIMHLLVDAAIKSEYTTGPAMTSTIIQSPDCSQSKSTPAFCHGQTIACYMLDWERLYLECQARFAGQLDNRDGMFNIITVNPTFIYKLVSKGAVLSVPEALVAPPFDQLAAQNLSFWRTLYYYGKKDTIVKFGGHDVGPRDSLLEISRKLPYIQNRNIVLWQADRSKQTMARYKIKWHSQPQPSPSVQAESGIFWRGRLLVIYSMLLTIAWIAIVGSYHLTKRSPVIETQEKI